MPGYPPSAGFAAPPPPPTKSKAVPIVLASVAILLVLCVGGTAAAFVAIRNQAAELTSNPDLSTPEAPASPSSAPPSPSAAPKRQAAPRKPVTLVAPARLNGRPKLTDPQFADAAKTLQDSLSRAPGATDSIGAIYGSPGDRNIVVVAAVAAPVPDPDRELSSTLLDAGNSGAKLTNVITVDPGPLGGTAQCGNSSASGVKMAMCVWADDGSVGWFIWYFKSASQVRKEFPKLRGLIEKPS